MVFLYYTPKTTKSQYYIYISIFCQVLQNIDIYSTVTALLADRNEDSPVKEIQFYRTRTVPLGPSIIMARMKAVFLLQKL